MNKHTLKFTKIVAAIAATIVLFSFGACNEMPSEFNPKQELILDQHEINIGDASTFEVSAYASSLWRVYSSASWCHIDEPLAYGRGSVVCNVDANRGDAARTFYVVVETFYKNNPILDSIRVTQEVNTKPILEVKPITDRLISSEGEAFDLTIEYNYGVTISVNYLEGEPGWITHSPDALAESDINPIKAIVNIAVAQNEVQSQRVAEVIFDSNTEGGAPCKVLITQKPALPLIPAVTSFADNFETASSQGELYVGQGWSFEANPADRNITFKQFTNGMKALLIHGSGIQATAYGVMPVFNISAMTNKTLSYRWAPGNSTVAGTEKFEVVASTDYKDDAFKATWVVVENVTNTENPTKIRPLSLQQVDLSSLAHLERVYIAFRYTGANSAYRFDDVKVGDVE